MCYCAAAEVRYTVTALRELDWGIYCGGLSKGILLWLGGATVGVGRKYITPSRISRGGRLSGLSSVYYALFIQYCSALIKCCTINGDIINYYRFMKSTYNFIDKFTRFLSIGIRF